MHVGVMDLEAFLGPSARWKCQNTPEDIRAGLKRAFDDAMLYPYKVRRHSYETGRVGKRSRVGVRIHLVEIGFATFWIADAPASPVILDFEYADREIDLT